MTVILRSVLGSLCTAQGEADLALHMKGLWKEQNKPCDMDGKVYKIKY